MRFEALSNMEREFFSLAADQIHPEARVWKKREVTNRPILFSYVT